MVCVRPIRDEDREAVIDLKWEMSRVEIERMPAGHPLAADRDPSREAAAAGVAGYEAIVRERGGEILVAENGGRVAGCIVWYPEAGSSSIRADVRERAQIAGFVVTAAERGSGIGKALMAEAERRIRARGLKRLVLGVVSWNAASIAFYEKDGFSPLEVTMAKRLD